MVKIFSCLSVKKTTKVIKNINKINDILFPDKIKAKNTIINKKGIRNFKILEETFS